MCNQILLPSHRRRREAVFITTVTLGKGASLAWPRGCVALTSATGSHLDGHHRGVITRIKNQRDVSARASHLFGSCVENRGKRKNTEIVTGFACNPPSPGSPTSTPRCDLEGKRAGGAKTDRTKCFEDPSRERPSASRPHFVPRRREMRALTNSGTGTPAGSPRFCSAGLFSMHGEERHLAVRCCCIFAQARIRVSKPPRIQNSPLSLPQPVFCDRHQGVFPRFALRAC